MPYLSLGLIPCFLSCSLRGEQVEWLLGSPQLLALDTTGPSGAAAVIPGRKNCRLVLRMTEPGLQAG